MEREQEGKETSYSHLLEVREEGCGAAVGPGSNQRI